MLVIDETRVQVLKEGGRDPTQKSFMFVAYGKVKQKSIVLFRYRRGRSTLFLRRLLRGYKGTLLSDGYDSYNKLSKHLEIPHAGCWDHARRYFVKLEKSVKGSKVAKTILDKIGKLYKIEKQAKEKALRQEELLKLRQEKSRHIIQKIHKFLLEKSNAAPQSHLGKAVNYTLNEWEKLTEFLNNPSIPISNMTGRECYKTIRYWKKKLAFF